MKKLNYLPFLIIFFLSSFDIFAQKDEKPDLFPVNGEVFHVDSIPTVYIDEITILSKPTYQTRRKIRKYNSLIRKVKKVYPYAVTANARILDIERQMILIKGEHARKRFVKEAEQKLIDEFEPQLVKLTFSEGRILLKLIDRETGKTSYELIQQLRGNFSAFFWQGIARLFGSNLKSEYDPDEEDKMIENIVVRIENNEL